MTEIEGGAFEGNLVGAILEREAEGVDISAGGVDVSAIIVNYASWPDTVCLAHGLLQAAEQTSLGLEILVVDNGSAAHPISATLEGLPAVRVIGVGRNAGYAAGVNVGWRASRGQVLLVMNPDLLVSRRFLREVQQWVRRLDEQRAEARDGKQAVSRLGGGATGVVGFGLLNRDGSVQHSAGYFPTMWWTAVGQWFPRARRKYGPIAMRLRAVDWVSGACFLADRQVFEKLGGMDERFFLYYEEVDFCWRARRLGWQVVQDPGVQVIHLYPLERRRVPPALRVVTRRSLLYYFQKNLPAWQFLLLAAVVWGQALAGELAAWPLKRLQESRGVWRAVRQAAAEMVRQRLLPRRAQAHGLGKNLVIEDGAAQVAG